MGAGRLDVTPLLAHDPIPLMAIVDLGLERNLTDPAAPLRIFVTPV